MDARAPDHGDALVAAALEQGFDRTPVGLLVIDATGQIRRGNPVAAALLGAGPSTLAGASLAAIGGQAMAQAVAPLLSGGGDQASAVDLHLPLTLPLNGRSSLFHLFAAPISTAGAASGTLEHGAFCILRDLSARLGPDDLPGVLDRMADMFYRSDAEGRLVAVSPAGVTMFGYQPEEVVGRYNQDFYLDPAERDAFIAQLREKGSVRGYDIQMVRKDGSAFWVSTTSWLTYGPDGQVTGSEGLVRDVTERKEAEARASESRLLIQALLDASTDAIMLFQPEGTLLAVNRVLAERFGHTPADLTGEDLYALFPPAVAEKRREQVNHAVRTRQPIVLVDERSGVHLHNTIYPVEGPGGKIDKVAVYSRDITDQVLAERRIQSYIADVERSNHDLEQFAYAASHDLREPLRMIGCYVDLLDRRHGRHLPEEAHDYITIVRSSVRRLDALIHDLLEFSRIGLGDLTPSPVDARAAVARVLRDLDHMVVEAGAEIAVVSPLPPVLGSREQVAQVFQNLIANAIRYRDPHRPCRVEIGYRPESAQAWGGAYYVADNGIGIAPEHQDRVFQVFQRLQARSENDTGAGGTGIGLALARRIVEHHGGKLWLESVVGQGSTFLFTLPPAV